jgi:hypothetical protein
MSLYIELSVLDNLDNRVRQLKSNASSLNLTSYYTCVYEPTEGESVDSVAPPWGGLTCPKTHTSAKGLLLSRLVNSCQIRTHVAEV